MCESQRADAKFTEKEWSTFFNERLHPALSPVNMKAQHVYNQDESGYFRSFLVNIGKVWARKGRRWVARKRGYHGTYITAMVCILSSRKNSNTSSVVDRENGAWPPFFKRGVPRVHKTH